VHTYHFPLFFPGKRQVPVEKIGQFQVERLGALEYRVHGELVICYAHVSLCDPVSRQIRYPRAAATMIAMPMKIAPTTMPTARF